MNTLTAIIRKSFGRSALLRDERGLSTVEYTIILVLIAASAIGLWVKFGNSLTERISESKDKFDEEVRIKDDE